MIDLNAIAKEIIENRKRRLLPSAYDLSKTTSGLAEEVGEWAKALRKNNTDEQADALVDIMIYCLGGLEILEVNPEEELLCIIAQNKTREHTGHHWGR